MADTYVSLKPAVDQFIEAIADKGIAPPASIIADGKIHRFSSNGKSDDDAGWYAFHDGDIPAGSFGDFRNGVSVPYWAADIGRALSSTEKEDFRKKQDDARAERAAEKAKRQAEAKIKAAGILKISSPARDGHLYLVNKDARCYGLRWWNDLLVVPMSDESGEVQSLQLIAADGDKKFLTGGKVKGCFYTIGAMKDPDTILIAEGYATAATIHEVTGLTTIVAYNANNLVSVAKTIRAQNPNAAIILCADDDWKTEGNPGMTKATEAAAIVDGKVIAPVFGDKRPDDATDFNDMAKYRGKNFVTRFFADRFFEGDDPLLTIKPDDTTDAMDTVLARPANSNVAPDQQAKRESQAAAKHSAAPLSPIASGPENVGELKTHFSADEYEIIQKIWKSVQRVAAYHTDTGYHILLDDKRKVIVTKDKIELSHKARHRPDEAYLAACEHARQFWDGKMDVHGDTQHRVKAWAYASAYGIQITNFAPTDKELIEAEKILGELRKDIEPTFSRPTSQTGRRLNVGLAKQLH